MRGLVDTLGGLFELTRLAFTSGFRFRGPYWTWRLHTAFGRGYPGRMELFRAVLSYGRWVYRQRRRTGNY